MDMELLSELLSSDGYIQVNKFLIRSLGLHEAILIGELLAEYRYWRNEEKLTDNKFYASQANIEENTGLNGYMQRKALTHLQDLGIVSVTKEGMPAKNYFNINCERLCVILHNSENSEEVLNHKSSKNSISSDVNFKSQVIENLNINNNNNNKNKKIKKTISKDIVEQSSSVFQFGSSKKSIKDNLYTKCINLINEFVRDKDSDELRDTLIEFLNARLQIKDKPFYSNNLKGILKKIQKWLDEGNSIEKVLEWINYSIEKGYTTVYEQKSKQQTYNPIKNKQTKDPNEKLVYDMKV